MTFGPNNVNGFINYVQYADGSSIVANDATESIIGAEITITPMEQLTESSTIPGATRFGDALLEIQRDSEIYHLATLADNVLIPDPSNGYGGVLQSTLIWELSASELPSRYLDEFVDSFYVTNDGRLQFSMLFLTDLLDPSNTNGLRKSGMSTEGRLDITLTAAVPEPSTLTLVSLGTLSMMGYVRWRRRRQRG